MREWITGRNPVFEVLRAGRRHCFQLLIAESAHDRGRLEEIGEICRQNRIPIEYVHKQRLTAIDANHQGVALQTSAYPYSTLQDIFSFAASKGEPLFLLVLDSLQDPQNLGTLLRTAEIVGVHGILLPLRHSASVTPSVVSASSGASEHLLIAQINLAQATREIKEAGAWVVGLEGSEQAVPVDQARLDGALALVVGSEGRGMRPLVRESCDLLVQLPMRGRIESLNASVAGSVALFFAWQKRGFYGFGMKK